MGCWATGRKKIRTKPRRKKTKKVHTGQNLRGCGLGNFNIGEETV